MPTENNRDENGEFENPGAAPDNVNDVVDSGRESDQEPKHRTVKIVFVHFEVLTTHARFQRVECAGTMKHVENLVLFRKI